MRRCDLVVVMRVWTWVAYGRRAGCTACGQVGSQRRRVDQRWTLTRGMPLGRQARDHQPSIELTRI